DQLDENDVHGALGDALGLLNTREQEILRRRFGLDGDEPQTLDDVGFSFRLTRERIRQLQEGALRKLRMRLRKKLERGI
ncbi:MAG TPA: sigma factor-like helix-turn-helix DNA-binding protein, partial [Candidatus Dormibacteraeota bacterium]|nr:sigma factor-like helix-turn-helix DNA-binding protein [Candidatus Dormibacteraeota bacterium]